MVMVYTRGVQCNGVPEGVQFNGVYQRGCSGNGVYQRGCSGNGVYQRGYSVMVYTSGGTV